MRMNNYLNTLENKMKSLPEVYSKEILNDYRSHFHEGLLMGRTEDHIADDLGDVDFIANNIIAEYYIENSNKIDNAKKFIKALNSVTNVGIGTLNLLIVAPILLSISAVVISLYLVDFCLLISPIFLILHLIDPTLPIYFGTNILWLKLIIVLIMTGSGYAFYKSLKKISGKIFGWMFRYIIKSIKFQVFKSKKYRM